jgi:hypothetical protein
MHAAGDEVGAHGVVEHVLVLRCFAPVVRLLHLRVAVRFSLLVGLA